MAGNSTARTLASSAPSKFCWGLPLLNRDKHLISARLVWLAQTIGREIMIAAHSAEIRVRRYDGARECEVVVFFRGRAMTLRCRDYDQAVEWARIECKVYKVADGFTVERQPSQTTRERI
jgi:hypothetical protein